MAIFIGRAAIPGRHVAHNYSDPTTTDPTTKQQSVSTLLPIGLGITRRHIQIKGQGT
jgi:hypothetical protein